MVYSPEHQSYIAFGDKVLQCRSVKLPQERRDMIASFRTKHNASTVVKNFLQTMTLGCAASTINGLFMVYTDIVTFPRSAEVIRSMIV